MNPCPCGHLGSRLRACRCSPDAVARYQGRVSGPPLDRIDVQIEVPAIPLDALTSAPDGAPSHVIAARVARVRERATARQGCLNAALVGVALDSHAALNTASTRFLQEAAARFGWSSRGVHRVLRLGRTIAGLADSAAIDSSHLAEAMQYRRTLGAA